MKFEEEVEEGGNRWSKPHVATLSLHSLFELRSMLLNGTICLDMSASNLDDITELLLDNMINSNSLTYDKKALVKEAILKRHRHQYEGIEKTHDHGDTKGEKGFFGSTASNISKLPVVKSIAAFTQTSKGNTYLLISRFYILGVSQQKLSNAPAHSHSVPSTCVIAIQ